MAYSIPWLKVSFLGTINGPNEEIWSNSYQFEVGSNVADVVQYLAAIESVPVQLQTRYMRGNQSNSPDISRRAELSAVKIAAIGTDGKYLTDAKLLPLATPVAGVAQDVENTRSLCVSYKSGVRRGGGANGRVYIPCYAGPVNGDGRVPTLAQQGVMYWGRDTANAIRDWISTGQATQAEHAIISASGGIGYVTRIRVGNVIDAQRRRKNRQYESYMETPAYPDGS